MPFDWNPIFHILGEGKVREADAAFVKYYNELVSGHADETEIREECVLYIMQRNRALNRKYSQPSPEDEMSLERLVDNGAAYNGAVDVLDRFAKGTVHMPAKK